MSVPLVGSKFWGDSSPESSPKKTPQISPDQRPQVGSTPEAVRSLVRLIGAQVLTADSEPPTREAQLAVSRARRAINGLSPRGRATYTRRVLDLSVGHGDLKVPAAHRVLGPVCLRRGWVADIVPKSALVFALDHIVDGHITGERVSGLHLCPPDHALRTELTDISVAPSGVFTARLRGVWKSFFPDSLFPTVASAEANLLSLLQRVMSNEELKINFCPGRAIYRVPHQPQDFYIEAYIRHGNYVRSAFPINLEVGTDIQEAINRLQEDQNCVVSYKQGNHVILEYDGRYVQFPKPALEEALRGQQWDEFDIKEILE